MVSLNIAAPLCAPAVGSLEAETTCPEAGRKTVAGVEMKAISTYVGHSSVAFTYDRYGHLLPGAMAENTAKLDAYLARSRAHNQAHEG